MRVMTPALLLLTLSGCINISADLQPRDLQVKPLLQGSDCVPIIFGIGIGTATVDAALAGGRDGVAEERERRLAREQRRARQAVPPIRIAKVQRLQLTDYGFLGFGARCLEVTGEP